MAMAWWIPSWPAGWERGPRRQQPGGNVFYPIAMFGAGLLLGMDTWWRNHSAPTTRGIAAAAW